MYAYKTGHSDTHDIDVPDKFGQSTPSNLTAVQFYHSTFKGWKEPCVHRQMPRVLFLYSWNLSSLKAEVTR